MKKACLLLAGGLFVASASAQIDPLSAWAQWKGNNAKSASVVASGPATTLAWTLEQTPALVDPCDPNGPMTAVCVSPGGMSLGGNGDIYYKGHDDGQHQIFRIDSATGTVLAQAPIDGTFGSYGGVTVGADELYVCAHIGGGNTAIHVLDKTTLATLRVLNPPEFAANNSGLRGGPLVSQFLNVNGHHNLYVADRDGAGVYAIDAVSGAVMWHYFLPIGVTATSFGAVGPQWATTDNRDAFGYFTNTSLGAGIALKDNGDNTFTILWENGGPHSFNWWGSGSLSADAARVYVTTFNDGDVPALWAVNTSDGSVASSIPGLRGQGPSKELNFFGRPAVVNNRVYCGGGFGVVAAFEDNGGTLSTAWKYQDINTALDPNDPNYVRWQDEVTGVAATRTPSGEVYIYAVAQGNDFAAPGVNGDMRMLVLRDDGATYTVMYDSWQAGQSFRAGGLAGEAATLFGSNSPMIDADGAFYFAAGSAWAGGNNPVKIYKFAPGSYNCVGDVDGDGDTDLGDLALLLGAFGSTNVGDLDGDGDTDLADLALLLGDFGCN